MKQKKYIISIDKSKDGKAGMLAEVKEDGTILVLAEKYQPPTTTKSLPKRSLILPLDK